MRQFRNNFDLLRFLLAASVVLFHLAVLSRMPAFTPLTGVANGTYGVLGFFAISGYVVTLSWRRSAGWRDYIEKRARRILPGYLAVVLFWWLAGSWISTLGVARYWANAATWRYLAANLSFLQFLAPDLPGVFTRNPEWQAVNGALWSIRTEIACYLMLPFVGRLPGLLALACGAAGAALVAIERLHPLILEIRVGVANPLTCFFLGMWLAQEMPASLRVLRWVAIPATALLLYETWRPAVLPAPLWAGIVMPVAISAAVLGAGLSLPYLGDWNLPGNLSYGMYLWHFPLIQFVLGAAWFIGLPGALAALCIALTMIAASLSWFGVERRFLARRAAAAAIALHTS